MSMRRSSAHERSSVPRASGSPRDGTSDEMIGFTSTSVACELQLPSAAGNQLRYFVFPLLVLGFDERSQKPPNLHVVLQMIGGMRVGNADSDGERALGQGSK